MLNKSDLEKRVIEKVKAEYPNDKITDAACRRVVSATFDAIKDCMTEGDGVRVIGFGAFEVKKRAARAGRNPQTGEPAEIPAHKTVSFKAGRTLKQIVNA